MIDQKTKDLVAKELGGLGKGVRLIVFTQQQECRYCEENRQLAEEVAALSPALRLEVKDFGADREAAYGLGIDKIPAIAVLSSDAADADYGIRFFGIPAGYEFTSLVEAIKTVGSDEPSVSPQTLAALGRLSAPVHLQVFVTPT